MDIYVGNLSSDTTEADLRNAFKAYGKVASVIIMRDKVSQNPLGFGFVKMPSDRKACAAAAALNGTAVNSRVIIAAETQRKGDRRSVSRVTAEILNFN